MTNNKKKKRTKVKKEIVYRTKEERQEEVKNILKQLSEFDLDIKYGLVDDWVQPVGGFKSVPTVWFEEFKDKLKVKTSFYRKDKFQGQHIPMVLVENISK